MQRDNKFYPAWAFGLPTTILRMPYSLVEGTMYSVVVYWMVGMTPEADRFFT